MHNAIWMRRLKDVPLKRDSSSRKAKISTTGIYRIFRGLKFEPRRWRDVPPDTDLPAVAAAQAGIGQKVAFCKGLRIGIVVTIGLALTISTGCAPAKVWISSPEIQTAGNPYYEARLEPVTGKYSFFVSFHLTVTNKSDNNLKINWNKTRYIHNGRRYGGFVFKGIKPEDIKNLTIPPDIIPAGDTFSKVISPYKLLAVAPIRDRGIGLAESGITPGIIPNGTNGILLVVRQNGKEIIEQMSVSIVESKM